MAKGKKQQVDSLGANIYMTPDELIHLTFLLEVDIENCRKSLDMALRLEKPNMYNHYETKIETGASLLQKIKGEENE